MNNVCNKMEEINVTDLKAFIYADDTILGDNMKEFEIKLAHWEEKGRITACR
jgi:hypothetical protein